MTRTHTDGMEASLATFCTKLQAGRAGRGGGGEEEVGLFLSSFQLLRSIWNVRGSERGALFHPLRPFINGHPLCSTYNALHCSSWPRAHGCGSVHSIGQCNWEWRCPHTLACIIYNGWHERNASIYIGALLGECSCDRKWFFETHC